MDNGVIAELEPAPSWGTVGGGVVRDAAGTPFEGLGDLDIRRSRDKAFFASCKALGLEACDIVVYLDRFATGAITPIAAARAMALHLQGAFEAEACVPAFEDESLDADARALCLGAYLLREQGKLGQVSRYAAGDYAFWHAASVDEAPAKTPEAASQLHAAAEAYRLHDPAQGRHALRCRTDPAFLDGPHAGRAFRMDEPEEMDLMACIDAWYAGVLADRTSAAQQACADVQAAAQAAAEAVRQEYETSSSYKLGRAISAPMRRVLRR